MWDEYLFYLLHVSELFFYQQSKWNMHILAFLSTASLTFLRLGSLFSLWCIASGSKRNTCSMHIQCHVSWEMCTSYVMIGLIRRVLLSIHLKRRISWRIWCDTRFTKARTGQEKELHRNGTQLIILDTKRHQVKVVKLHVVELPKLKPTDFHQILNWPEERNTPKTTHSYLSDSKRHLVKISKTTHRFSESVTTVKNQRHK